MNRFFGTLAAGLTAATLTSPASASVIFSETHDITGSGPGSVGQSFFSIVTDATHWFYTAGPTIDPVLYLFQDAGVIGVIEDDLTDILFAVDDDSCPDAVCGPAGAFANALFSIFLSAGTYALAVSDFGFDVGEARSGTNVNVRTGEVTVFVSDTAPLPGAVPLPATLPLLLAGMGGLALARRHKR